MESSTEMKLSRILQSYLELGFTGSIFCARREHALQIWFVRGELVHATTNDGAIGWDALAGAKQQDLHVISLVPDELPPQRSIRISTVRLLEALTHVQSSSARDRMTIPLPFHERLQSKFREVQRRVNGLKTFESHEGKTANQSSTWTVALGEKQVSPADASERIIIEVNPRGAKWLHHAHGQELLISGDNNVTTTDILWAGEELRREFNRLNKEAPENE